MLGDEPDFAVAAIFDDYPLPVRAKLLGLRSIIQEVENENPEIGGLIETLKWGQVSYLPKRPRIGTTVRIDRVKREEHKIAVYFHCQTNLIASFKDYYPTDLAFDGNRAIILDGRHRLPKKALAHCIGIALTYHLRKSRLHTDRLS